MIQLRNKSRATTPSCFLINLLHRRRRRRFQWRRCIFLHRWRSFFLLFLIDVKTESIIKLSVIKEFISYPSHLRNHAMDTLSERRRLIQSEPRSEQRSFKQQVCQIPNGLVSLVLCNFPLQLLDDRVMRVQLQRLLRCHV
jgi:hypothetical protein